MEENLDSVLSHKVGLGPVQCVYKREETPEEDTDEDEKHYKERVANAPLQAWTATGDLVMAIGQLVEALCVLAMDKIIHKVEKL